MFIFQVSSHDKIVAVFSYQDLTINPEETEEGNEKNISSLELKGEYWNWKNVIFDNLESLNHLRSRESSFDWKWIDPKWQQLPLCQQRSQIQLLGYV